MSKNHTVGGKGRPAVDKPPKLKKPEAALVLVPCECGKKMSTWLLPGGNDVTAVCECGAVIHIRVHYDGRGLANIYEGSIERVEPG